MKYPQFLSVICLLLMLVSASFSFAQEFPGKLIFQGFEAYHLSWSTDSRQFAVFFANEQALLELPDPSWIAYDVSTDTITQHNRWPFQPELTPEEMAFFAPSEWAGNRKSYIYKSPDDQYIVYASGVDEAKVPHLTIGNRLTRQRTDISIIYFPFTGPDDFDVRWSADSSAFVMLANPPYGEGYTLSYFNNFKNNLTAISPELFLHGLKVNNTQYLSRDFYELSANGNLALMKILKNDPTVQEASDLDAQLILYNIADPDATTILDIDAKMVLTACFALDDENTLTLINEDGLVQYNIASQTTSVLSTAVRFDNVSKALCSPDGQSLAYVIGDVDTDKAVYVVRISDLGSDADSQSPTRTGRTAVQLDGPVTFFDISDTGEFLSIGTLPDNFGVNTKVKKEWEIPTADDISVSPNGQYVAFVAYRDEQDVSLFIYSVEDGHLRQHSVEGLGSIKWSPDSDSLFLTYPDIYWGFPSIVKYTALYDIETDTLEEFLPTSVYMPQQLPDNQTINYVGISDIYTVGKVEKKPIALTNLNVQLPLELPRSVSGLYWSVLNERTYFIITDYADDDTNYDKPLDYLYSVSSLGDIRLEAALPILYPNKAFLIIVGIHTSQSEQVIYVTVESWPEIGDANGAKKWHIIKLASPAIPEVIYEAENPLELNKSAISPNGKYLALNGYIQLNDGDEGLVQILDLANGEIIINRKSNTLICDIQWLNNYGILFSESPDGCSHFGAPLDIWTLDIDTNTATNLTENLPYPVRLIPSPEVIVQ